MIEKSEIVGIRKIKLIKKTMYDIETEKNHNFFANGVLVHNSGTNFRDDGKDMSITAAAGEKIYDLGAEELTRRGFLVRPTVTFFSNYMDFENIKMLSLLSTSGLINETEGYLRFYETFITENEKRNDLIAKIVVGNEGKKTIILTKHIAHGKELCKRIEGSRHLYGDTPKKERKKIFDDFIKGEFTVLISTISIFSEGIDIPSLSVIINAGANAGKVKTIQMIGRVMRLFENKKNATYYDFLDEHKFFKKASWERIEALKSEGHQINIVRL